MNLSLEADSSNINSDSELPLPSDCDLSSYQFTLPPHLIAQHPASQREQSRLMLLSKNSTAIAHHHFHNFVDLLPEYSTLILNNTKVFPAKLIGKRNSGAVIEALLIEEQKEGVWECFLKNAKRVRIGEKLSFAEGKLEALAITKLPSGRWHLQFLEAQYLMQRLAQSGFAPLPPYIKRNQATDTEHEEDRQRYQTCFASEQGAIAAPTAGLHFTPEILQNLKKRGIKIIELTLHVGYGTFATLTHSDVRKHTMHSESLKVSAETLQQLHESIRESRPLIAVGTTVIRTLESLAQLGATRNVLKNDPHCLKHYENEQGDIIRDTNIFIRPPYDFQLCDGLLTNFHLPNSSLLLLVSAFYGRERMLEAYQKAIQNQYRFFSYGDCMLIL